MIHVSGDWCWQGNSTAQPLTVGAAACRVSAAPLRPFPGPGAHKGHPTRNCTESERKYQVSLLVSVQFSNCGCKRSVSHLHEQLHALVVAQEVVAQLHPLWHQVQDLPFPLQSFSPILHPAALGTVGGFGVKARTLVRWWKWSMNEIDAHADLRKWSSGID